MTLTKPGCLGCGGEVRAPFTYCSDCGIGRYYARCDEQRRAAWAELRAARERGAPADEIRRLQRRYDQAAYTGD